MMTCGPALMPAFSSIARVLALSIFCAVAILRGTPRPQGWSSTGSQTKKSNGNSPVSSGFRLTRTTRSFTIVATMDTVVSCIACSTCAVRASGVSPSLNPATIQPPASSCSGGRSP